MRLSCIEEDYTLGRFRIRNVYNDWLESYFYYAIYRACVLWVYYYPMSNESNCILIFVYMNLFNRTPEFYLATLIHRGINNA